MALHRIVVGILDLLQQFAIVVEEAGNALAQDQFLDDANGQMGLADADAADEQQAGASRPGYSSTNLQAARRDGGQRAMRTVKLEIGELAMFVALGNARRREQRLGACLQAAIAARHPPFGADRD